MAGGALHLAVPVERQDVAGVTEDGRLANLLVVAAEASHQNVEHHDLRVIDGMVNLVGRSYDVASLQLLSRAVECLQTNPDPFDPVVHVKSK